MLPAQERVHDELAALGRAVRRYREDAGLTQLELAAAANMHWRTLVRLEHAEVAVSVDKLFAVAAALHLRLSELIEHAESDAG